MSHIRKDLTEVKDMLIRSNEILALHMKRVEPMLLSYEKDIIIKESYNHVGDSVVKWSVRVGAVSALGGTFYWLIKTIKNL